MIYLDNSATTQVDEEVLDAMLPWLRGGYGNASSIYKLGREARVAIEDARTTIASSINAHPAEITFTSGGTESNNTVLRSCLIESRLADALYVGATEHHAILAPAEELSHQGYPYTVLPVDSDGLISQDVLASHNTRRTLVSVMHANNETGVIQPLSEIRALMSDVYLHSDAVQTFGKIPIDVETLGVDFLTMSAHKIHGPKGIGMLFIKKGIDFKAHQQGGGQERNRRAGTEPVALIVGAAVAAQRAVTEMERRSTHMRSLVDLARQLIIDQISQVRFNTPITGCVPNILNVSFVDADRLDGEAILQSMDMHGIAVSNGSACVSGSVQPSHVLRAMGRPHREAKAAVRFSVSKDNTIEEITQAVAILGAIVRDLRG
ncbi:MAG: cysteine desulfurase family protein [Candidatus Kapabacteria bacterium]|nr:cysteine desulfurase family protein [Candidatus Kapabacteria bacterium]